MPRSLCRGRRSASLGDWLLATRRSSLMKLNNPDLLCMQAHIGGARVNADNGGTVEVMNPATREPLGTVPDMGAAETRRAIAAAGKALPAWAAKTAKERALILRRWYDLMMANQEDLATLMTA